MSIRFSFLLTERCAWTCEYCYFSDVVEQKEPSLGMYKKHVPYIKEVIDKIVSNNIQVYVEIQGGEVGSIPIEILQYFFQTIKHPIAVSTNGEFVKNQYHLDKEIRPYIEVITWHVSEDFKEIISDYHDKEIFISRGIVHNNEREMIDFIKTNSHILFDYVEFEFDKDEERVIDHSMYESLIKNLMGLNVTDHAMQILKSRLLEKEDDRINCRNLNSCVVIDLVNEKICLCQRQPDDHIPLNRRNLIRRLKGFPKDFFEGRKCNTCTRLYSGKMKGTMIETSMKLRGIL